MIQDSGIAHLAIAMNTELAHWLTAFSGEASILSPSQRICCGSVCALQLTRSPHRSSYCFLCIMQTQLKCLTRTYAQPFSIQQSYSNCNIKQAARSFWHCRDLTLSKKCASHLCWGRRMLRSFCRAGGCQVRAQMGVRHQDRAPCWAGSTLFYCSRHLHEHNIRFVADIAPSAGPTAKIGRACRSTITSLTHMVKQDQAGHRHGHMTCSPALHHGSTRQIA